MRTSNRGFTLIELMVALVIAGLLMASLVALSGSVQRNFGRQKDITEIQANLRFAMRSLAEDFGRVSLMVSPDPVADYNKVDGFGVPKPCHTSYYDAAATPLGPSITYDIPTSEFILRGNYVSTRDYLWNKISGHPEAYQILCRNGLNPSVASNCGFNDGGGANIGYENYLKPFGDGPDFGTVFCAGEAVRAEFQDKGMYGYFKIQSVNPGLNQVVPDADAVLRERLETESGYTTWVSPVTTVRYGVALGAYTRPLYAGGVGVAGRWVLRRTTDDCRGVVATDIADFLLPMVDPHGAHGLSVDIYVDNSPNASMCGAAWLPDIQAPAAFYPAPLGALPPERIRAVAITLRGRTEMEDPAFMIPGYVGNEAAQKNFGIDLDGMPDDGLAHVRVERTVVEFRNQTFGLSPS
jgi:prepilin-type N-terminal cleavage/methylation domain-containing protein